jgi:hypothetical protein
MERPICTFLISSADVAGAKRLQHQRTLPVFVGGVGYAHATHKNGMLPYNLARGC